MHLLEVLIVFSSLSFFAYGVAYFTSPHMKSEFIRFGLGKLGGLTAVLEILGAIGLLVGLILEPILILSSGSLALLMFLGISVRLKIRDTLLEILPALFFLILNAYIFYESMKLSLD
jgi:hypothetical protein